MKSKNMPGLNCSKICLKLTVRLNIKQMVTKNLYKAPYIAHKRSRPSTSHLLICEMIKNLVKIPQQKHATMSLLPQFRNLPRKRSYGLKQAYTSINICDVFENMKTIHNPDNRVPISTNRSWSWFLLWWENETDNELYYLLSNLQRKCILGSNPSQPSWTQPPPQIIHPQWIIISAFLDIYLHKGYNGRWRNLKKFPLSSKLTATRSSRKLGSNPYLMKKNYI